MFPLKISLPCTVHHLSKTYLTQNITGNLHWKQLAKVENLMLKRNCHEHTKCVCQFRTATKAQHDFIPASKSKYV